MTIGLTLTDLSTHDNVVQARWELARTDSATTLAAWAEKWGEAACDALDIAHNIIDHDEWPS